MEAKRKQEKSFCRLCWWRCALEITIDDGRVVKVTGDKSFPLRQSTPCAKGLALPEILNHPKRLKYPQKRQGRRGEGKWTRISWDEALSLIADRMSHFEAEFGGESVVIGLGEPKGLELAFAQRLASVFGTPNVATPGHVCHVPRELASAFTLGSPCIPDSDNPPRCLIVWGNNFIQTHSSSFSITQFRSLTRQAKLIVIDPQKTRVASQANIWLKPRPGSDGALALGMLKIIIEEELYDKQFVANWTVGFDELKRHVKNHSLNKIEEVTWIPKEQIKETARLYATTKPAAIQWGNALETSANSFQTCRAISILRAITANLDTPGGDIMSTPLPLVRPANFMLLRDSPRKPEKALGSEFKLATRSAFIPRQSVINSILEEKPYPVKGALLFGTDPLLTYPDAARTYEAFTKLEFLALAELFMTPTAELADIVLPAATNLEFDEIGPFSPFFEFSLAYPEVVQPPGECWPDIRIINELAKKLGLEQYFWGDEKEALDVILKPSGLTFEEFKEKRILQQDKQYKKYEKAGFRTPSGKVEMYSQQLNELGYSPLPVYTEPTEAVHHHLELSKDYPLVLTSAKPEYFSHSGHRGIASLRQKSPEPIVRLNSATAAELGLKEGDWVYIETKRGRIKQKLSLNSHLDPRVAVADYGWWFPEKRSSRLYGWDDSNMNVLTDSQAPCEPAIGSANFRGFPCKIYRV